MLQDPTGTKRLAAAVVISELVPEEEEVLDALRAVAKKDSDTRVRRWVVEAIGALAPDTMVSDLGPLLADPSREVRSAVKNVLASSDAVTESDMQDMLNASNEKARKSAIAVLGAMGTGSAQTMLLTSMYGAKSKIITAIIDALRHPMIDGDAQSCKHIVNELGSLIRSEEKLNDPSFGMAAVQLLGYGGSFGSLEVLMKLAAQASDVFVRVSALETVQRIAKGKHPQVFEGLLDIAEDEALEPDVRMASLHALENLDIPMTMDTRVRDLTTVSLPSIRRWSITALGGRDSAPAAATLMNIVAEGVTDDRELAMAGAMRTASGRVAAAKLLGKLTEPDRAEMVARALRSLKEDLTQDVKSALEKSVMEAPPEVGQHILGILKHSGGAKALEGDLLKRALLLMGKKKFTDASGMLSTLCQGLEVDPDARFNLGVCELKQSKRKIVRGTNNDACLATISELLTVRDYSVLEKLTSEQLIEEEDMYYLGFSFAERSDNEQGLGGDLLLHLMENSKDKALRDRAANKLKTMGWIE